VGIKTLKNPDKGHPFAYPATCTFEGYICKFKRNVCLFTD